MIDLKSKKYGIISLGCDKNRVDIEKLLAIIKANGCEITDEATDAQVLVINTCAFLNEARKEAVDTVLEFSSLKSKNLEKIVVTGCLPQKYVAETFPALKEADVFLGTDDYDRFFEAIEQAYCGERVNFVGTGSHGFNCERLITTPAHYAYLKIADGCNNRCTYCLIPKIRGKYVSYQMEQLLKEAVGLGDIAELILVAQDVTRYGLDLYGQKKLVEILKKLTKLVNINSVRLLYCYPDMIDDGLIAEIRDNPKIVKYLDIPLQHSEDRLLKLMNRPAGREEYLALFERLRKEIPDISIRSTSITAGFLLTLVSPTRQLISYKVKYLILKRKNALKNCTKCKKVFLLKSFKVWSAKKSKCFATVLITIGTALSDALISRLRKLTVKCISTHILQFKANTLRF